MVAIPGIGYQPEDINSPVPNADAGMISARADVAGAGAGMAEVAKAGKELSSVADKIARQEDMTAVLKIKNETTTQLNQDILDFQSKVTGSPAVDMAAWDAVSSKRMQTGLAQATTDAQRESLTRELDTLHKASAVQIQGLSHKALDLNFKTEVTGQVVNVTKAMQTTATGGLDSYLVAAKVSDPSLDIAGASVKARGLMFADLATQFRQIEDLVHSSATMNPAEQESYLQAAKQHAYMEAAKLQADSKPGAFSAAWRAGDWQKELTPEAVAQLDSFAKKAEVDNAYNNIFQMFPGQGGQPNTTAAIRYIDNPKNLAEMPVLQRRELRGMFTSIEDRAWNNYQRGLTRASEAGHVALSDAIINGDSAKAEAIARDPRSPAAVKDTYARIVMNGGLDFRGNRELEAKASGELFAGTKTIEDVRALVSKDGLSLKQANNIIDRFTKTSSEDKITLRDIREEAKNDNIDVGQIDNYMQYVLYLNKNKGFHGQDLFFEAKKARTDNSSWWQTNNAPYRVWSDANIQSRAIQVGDAPAAPAATGAGSPVVLRYDPVTKTILKSADTD